MLNEKIKKQIDEIFNDFTQPNTPGCTISVIKDGEVVFKNVYGLANLELEVPITEDTVFDVGSVSKQFTAMCIALMEESGNIDLSDCILRYIPELPPYFSKITVADLIYMTNGIRDFYHITQYMMGVVEDDFVNEEEVMKLLCSIQTPIFSPGEKWMYGNSGYFLLSILVKRITGKTLAQYAQENIFIPLGMKNTFFRDDRTKIIKNRASGYCKSEYLHHSEQEQMNPRDNHCLNVDNYELTGAGQLWTTIGDLYLWDQNYYNNKLGKGNKELITKVATAGKLKTGEACGYGYGLFLGERNGKKYQFHGGSTAGFLSAFYRVPDDELTVIFLSNSNYSFYHISDQLGMGVDKYIGDLVLEQNPSVKEPPFIEDHADHEEKLFTKVSSNELEGYTGSYQCPETSTVWEIEYKDEILQVKENREQDIQLKVIDQGNFEAIDGSLKCKFIKQQKKGFQLWVYKADEEHIFLPFIGELSVSELTEYIGEYHCNQLDTTFIITVEKDKLFIKNKDRHRNGIDFIYSPSIEDHFINFNSYAGSMMITFNRDDATNKIISFVYRDYDGDGRECLEFERLV